MSCASSLTICVAAVALFGVNARAQTVQVAPPITAAILAPAEGQLLLGSQRGLEKFHLSELKSVGRLKTDLRNIHDLTVSPDGKSLLVAGGSPGEEGVVEIIEWLSGKQTRRVVAHEDVIYRVAWSPTGDSYCTASGDGICNVFDKSADKPILKYGGHSRPVLAIEYLSGGELVVSAGVDQTLQMWNAATGELVRKFDNHLATINDLAVRPNLDDTAPPMVATASEDRTVRFWQPTIGRLVRFAKLDSVPRTIAWDAAGKYVIAGCNDGRVRMIDFETATVSTIETQFPGRIHTLVAISESTALVAGEGGQFELIQLTEVKPALK